MVVMQRTGTTEEYEQATFSRGMTPYATPYHWFICYSSTGEQLDVAPFALRNPQELLLHELEKMTFTSLAEASFAEDWDSDADSIYDNEL